MSRWLPFLYGAAVLFWLELEDNAVLPVVVLGAAGAVLLVARHWRKYRAGGMSGHPQPLAYGANTGAIAGAVLGAITGVVASLATAFLMLLKTGMHSHVFPDYPLPQILAILQRAPAWALAGALAGIGLALGRSVIVGGVRPSSEVTTPPVSEDFEDAQHG